MKYDLTVVLTDLDDKTIENGVAGDIIARALLAPTRPDKPLSGEQSYQRYQLATRINASTNNIELSHEDAVLIKEVVAAVYAPIIVGRIYDLLEEVDKKEDKK